MLVNNAGYGLLGAVEEATAEEIEAVYRTNVFGLLPVTRAVLPQGSSRGSATDGSHPTQSEPLFSTTYRAKQ